MVRHTRRLDDELRDYVLDRLFPVFE